jgi:subtilase family serine protease
LFFNLHNNNYSWASEVALDVQAVHLFAPAAKILLVVCNTDSFSDFMAGVTYAKAHANIKKKKKKKLLTIIYFDKKVDYVSMSWSAKEEEGVNTYFDPYFESTTTSFFASTGDNGQAGGIAYPAASQYVIAVGGTSIYTNSDGTLSSEQGWSGSGGGYSNYTTAIAAQQANSGYGSETERREKSKFSTLS